MGDDTLNALPTLHETVAIHGLRADKSLGQHFLLDLNLTRSIARLASPLGLDLSDAFAFDTRLRLKPSDMYLHELLRPDPRSFIYGTQKQEFAAEGHSRLAAPLYNVALVILALCFMVRGEHQRLGYSRRIIICCAIGFVLRIFGFAAASAAEADMALNIVQYALPGLMIVGGAIYLNRRNRDE